MTTVVCLGIVVALVSIAFIWFWWSNRNSILINWPLLGMIPPLLYNATRIHDFLTDVLQQCYGTFFFKGPWFSGMDSLITSDPVNVHHTFSKNFSNYPKGPQFNEIFDFLGDGIFTVDSDMWRMQRNMIHSLFKDKRFELAVHASVHQKISKGLFAVLNHACELGTEVDFKDVFQRFTFDNFCFLIFGMDPKTLSIGFPSAPHEKAFDDIAQVFLYRHIVPGFIWKLQRWLQIGEEKKMTKACNTFNNFVENCVKRKQEQLQKEKKIHEFDALTYLMQVKDENHHEVGKLSNKLVRDIALNLLIAGRDTTSAALSWTFWLIGKNPSSQKKILEEMAHHFGRENDDKERIFDFENIKKLVYLHGAICEALRLYPSVPIERKASVESDILPSGHRISKNTIILYSLYSMGRMKEIWGEDCLEFKPERWISESGGIKHQPSYKFVAFNAGPRTCLGKDMSLLQMKTIVCGILWNYSLELSENQNVRPSSSIILHQKNGVKFRVFKRNDT